MIFGGLIEGGILVAVFAAAYPSIKKGIESWTQVRIARLEAESRERIERERLRIERERAEIATIPKTAQREEEIEGLRHRERRAMQASRAVIAEANLELMQLAGQKAIADKQEGQLALPPPPSVATDNLGKEIPERRVAESAAQAAETPPDLRAAYARVIPEAPPLPTAMAMAIYRRQLELAEQYGIPTGDPRLAAMLGAAFGAEEVNAALRTFTGGALGATEI